MYGISYKLIARYETGELKNPTSGFSASLELLQVVLYLIALGMLFRDDA